ncbi:MAG: transposase [Planctomycetota bacterium]|nr:MAG: transposase [Planctomycetota bacterium]
MFWCGRCRWRTGKAERRACRVLGFSRTTTATGADVIRGPSVRLRDLAASRVHYGYPRLWVLLRREGWLVNKKLVYRLYCEEGLGIRRKKPRRRKSVLASGSSFDGSACQ